MFWIVWNRFEVRVKVSQIAEIAQIRQFGQGFCCQVGQVGTDHLHAGFYRASGHSSSSRSATGGGYGDFGVGSPGDNDAAQGNAESDDYPSEHHLGTVRIVQVGGNTLVFLNGEIGVVAQGAEVLQRLRGGSMVRVATFALIARLKSEQAGIELAVQGIQVGGVRGQVRARYQLARRGR